VIFLRAGGMHTWRYFAEHSAAEHNWLIPDNVQEEPPAIAARVSPTNIGLLLNARQAACELDISRCRNSPSRLGGTLAAVSSLRKHHGTLLNLVHTSRCKRWLRFLCRRWIAGTCWLRVDAANKVALDRCGASVQPCLAEGFLDHLRVLATRLHR